MKYLLMLALLFGSVCNADEYIVLFKNTGKIETQQKLDVNTLKFFMQEELNKNLTKLDNAEISWLPNWFDPFSKIAVRNHLWAINGFTTNDVNWGKAQFLRLLPNVASVVPSKYRQWIGPLIEEDKVAKPTYGLENTNVIKLQSRYPSLTGKGMRVGLIDTGIDAKHPELAGKVVGWKDFIASKPDPYDDHGHGTHCAGTILGGYPEAVDRIGIAPDANVVVAKVFSATGGATDTVLLTAMQWMTEQKVSVVSNSWGGTPDTQELEKESFKRMVDTWNSLDMFGVFAAGNSGPSANTVGSPGGLPEAFAVAAVDKNNKVASFSSRGPITWKLEDGSSKAYVKPDIAAPGVSVYSAAPGGKYVNMSGTSMATPHVAGISVLVRQAYPKLTVVQIKELLSKSANKLGETVKTNILGEGLIDADAAIR